MSCYLKGQWKEVCSHCLTQSSHYHSPYTLNSLLFSVTTCQCWCRSSAWMQTCRSCPLQLGKPSPISMPHLSHRSWTHVDLGLD